MHKVVVGDMPVPEGATSVKSFRKSNFMSKGFEENVLFVDAECLKLRADDIKWILKNSVRPVIILAKNRSKLKHLPRKNVEVLERNPWGVDLNIFKCLDTILKERDRQKVLSYLEETKPPPIVIFNWLVSNVDRIGNRSFLEYLDRSILNKKPAIWFYQFLAFGIKTVQAGFIRYQYRIGRG